MESDSNIIDDMKNVPAGKVSLIEKVCQVIEVNGKKFKIEEPSRKRLQQYLELSSKINMMVASKAGPLIEMRNKIENNLLIGETEEAERLKKEFQEYAEKMPAGTDIDEVNDEILRFILFLGPEDQEWVDQLGPKQRQKIIEVAEDIYDIAEIAKKGMMILSGGR